MKSELSGAVIKGIQWTTLATVINSVMQVAYTSIMSRILDPQSFGIMAVAQFFITFITYFASMGMGSALIQKNRISQIDVRAVFTSVLVLVLMFAAITWISAPLANNFFDKVDPEVVPIIRGMAIIFLISGFSITPLSLLTRELRFNTLAKIEIFSYTISYIGVGVTLGLLDFGIWSLVFAQMSQASLSALLMYLNTKHSMLPVFGWKNYKPFFSYGSKFQLASFIEFVGGNFHTVLIGKFLGDYQLGLYRQAFMIAHLPLVSLIISIKKVVFPYFSRIQNDIVKFKRVYLAVITLLSSFLFPATIGMSIASKEIVLVMFGIKFADAIPVLAILSLGMSFRFLSAFGSLVCDSTARLNAKLIIECIFLILIISLTYIFRNKGLIVFAAIVTVGEVVRNSAYMLLAGKILNVTLIEYIRAYYTGILIGLVIGFILFVFTSLINIFITEKILIVLISQMVIGFILLFYLLIYNPPRYLKSVLSEQILVLPYFKTIPKKYYIFLPWYSNAN